MNCQVEANLDDMDARARDRHFNEMHNFPLSLLAFELMFITMQSKKDMIDLYFMDARCKLIEIAAYQDRVDRHEGEIDFRHLEFLKALKAMQNPPEGRTRTQAVLESLSDHSDDAIPKATIQFAYGAPGASENSSQ